MSLRIPDVLTWDLQAVVSQLDNLRRDSELLLDSADAVRAGRDSEIGQAEGDTATAAIDGCVGLARDIGVIGRKAERAVEALADFAANAPALHADLLQQVQEAFEASCRVQDDGTVLGPLLLGDPGDPALASELRRYEEVAREFQDRILPLLRDLEQLDLAAANALNLMAMVESYEFYPHEPDEIWLDPLTTSAGVSLTVGADLAGDAASARGLSSTLARAIPFVGTAAGAALGTATRAPGESIAESLAAEAVGVAASTTTVAAGGAALGSVVPGPGTIAGFIGGAVTGTAIGLASSLGMRQVFADQRADGKVDFTW